MSEEIKVNQLEMLMINKDGKKTIYLVYPDREIEVDDFFVVKVFNTRLVGKLIVDKCYAKHNDWVNIGKDRVHNDNCKRIIMTNDLLIKGIPSIPIELSSYFVNHDGDLDRLKVMVTIGFLKDNMPYRDFMRLKLK